jgi:glycosyltransferase involved in cell wall biosynthesis
MKKILIVNDHFPPHHWGGANSIAYLQAKGLQERGYEVFVLVTSQKFEEAGESFYEGIRVHTVYTEYHPRWWAWRSLYNPSAVAGFKKVLKAFDPDIVHFHNIHHYFSYYCIAVAKRSRAKVFLTAHDVMSFAYRKLRPGPYRVSGWRNLQDARKRFNPWRNSVIRRFLRQVDTIFAVSHALKDALAENGIAGNVEVVHNGIDTGRYELCPMPQEPTALFVGRFTPDKGRDVLLRAFALVVQKLPEARLVVVGFDSTEPALELLLDKLNIRKRVMLVPPILYPEMPSWYCKATIVIVPSIIFDSFPTANLEAFAAARPVIATCFGGSPELVIDGTGYIVDPRDIEALSKKILTLLGNIQTAESMGANGRERLQSNFKLEDQLAGYEKFYYTNVA